MFNEELKNNHHRIPQVCFPQRDKGVCDQTLGQHAQREQGINESEELRLESVEVGVISENNIPVPQNKNSI